MDSSDVLTSWTIGNKTLPVDTVLPELACGPLLVTPGTTKIEPTGTLRRLSKTSGPGTGRGRDRTG